MAYLKLCFPLPAAVCVIRSPEIRSPEARSESLPGLCSTLLSFGVRCGIRNVLSAMVLLDCGGVGGLDVNEMSGKGATRGRDQRPPTQNSGPGKNFSDGFSAALCHGNGHASDSNGPP